MQRLLRSFCQTLPERSVATKANACSRHVRSILPAPCAARQPARAARKARATHITELYATQPCRRARDNSPAARCHMPTGGHFQFTTTTTHTLSPTLPLARKSHTCSPKSDRPYKHTLNQDAETVQSAKTQSQTASHQKTKTTKHASLQRHSSNGLARDHAAKHQLKAIIQPPSRRAAQPHPSLRSLQTLS